MPPVEALLAAHQGRNVADDAGPHWMRTLRNSARTRFETEGLPGPKDEAWRYTPMRPLERVRFAAPDPTATPVDAARVAALATPGLDADRLVFIDGRLVVELSSTTAVDGVSVSSLNAVLAATPQRLEPWFGRLAGDEPRGFAALNAAFHSDGAVIEFSPNTQAPRVIELLFLSTSGDAAPLSHPRVLVIAGEGARGVIVERYMAVDGGCYLTTPVTEIHVGAAANIEHYRIQREATAAFHFGALHVALGRDSVYRNHNLAFGGAMARLDLDVVIDGEGALCDLNGLYRADGRRHVDNHTGVVHRVPRSSSRQLYKGVLDGRGRGVFRGRVVVNEGARGTDAQQRCDNLVLSPHAEADALPQLEIYNDDVKCSHGATVGQLDDVALFYLQSRGIDLARAQALLTYAFAAEVLARAGVDAVRREMESALAGELLPGEEMEFLP